MRNLGTIFLIFASWNVNANVIQYFTGITYSNPAELFQVQKHELILGGTGFITDARFHGSVLNFNSRQPDSGHARSLTRSFLPYGRIANRFNDKFVAAVDVTQPFHSNLDWGNHAVTRFAATQTFLTDVDVSPRLAYSLNKRWHFGAGLNLNFLQNNETNWAFPTGPTSAANLMNPTASFGLGYNLGFYHILNENNFFGVTYYSRIKQETKGTSTLGNRINPSLQFDFFMPATTVANYVHLFNRKWLANLKLFYTQWSVNQYVIYRNTAAPPPNQDFTFPMRFSNSFAYLGAIRHQYTDKLGLTFLGLLDNGPERDHLRTINFPADTQYFLALVADYKTSKNTSVELLYGHGFSNTAMQNRVMVAGQSVPFTTGKVNINADVVDLVFKISV